MPTPSLSVRPQVATDRPFVHQGRLAPINFDLALGPNCLSLFGRGYHQDALVELCLDLALVDYVGQMD